MAVSIEVMYAGGNLAEGFYRFRRKRVPVELAHTLPKNGLLFIILSAVTTAARSRKTVDGNPVERVSEWASNQNPDSTEDSAILVREAGQIVLSHTDDFSWNWSNEDAPFSGAEETGLPPTVPRNAVMFYGVKIDPQLFIAARDLFVADMY